MSFYFITLDDGSRLELMNKQGMADPDKQLKHSGFARIAFSAGSKKKVDALTAARQR